MKDYPSHSTVCPVESRVMLCFIRTLLEAQIHFNKTGSESIFFCYFFAVSSVNLQDTVVSVCTLIDAAVTYIYARGIPSHCKQYHPNKAAIIFFASNNTISNCWDYYFPQLSFYSILLICILKISAAYYHINSKSVSGTYNTDLQSMDTHPVNKNLTITESLANVAIKITFTFNQLSKRTEPNRLFLTMHCLCVSFLTVHQSSLH